MRKCFTTQLTGREKEPVVAEFADAGSPNLERAGRSFLFPHSRKDIKIEISRKMEIAMQRTEG